MTNEKLKEAYYNDTTVHAGMCAGYDIESIINLLVADKQRQLKLIERLIGIAPRKIKLPDGKVMIWRCPDELVPENLV